MRNPIAVLGSLVLLCGCAPAADKFAAPADWSMKRCPALQDIPANNGDPKVRRIYDAATRAEYAKCSNKHAALASYVELIRK